MTRPFIAGMLAALAAGGCRQIPQVPAPSVPALSIEQRRAMQTRAYDAPADTVFAATIATLQDLGWTLDVADRAAGLIRASTQRRLEAFGPEDETQMNLAERKRTAEMRADVSKKWARWKEIVIHTESWGAAKSRQRIVMNFRGTLPAMSYREKQGGDLLHRGREVLINAPATEQSVEVPVPEAYKDLFDRISEAVGQRTVPGGGAGAS